MSGTEVSPPSQTTARVALKRPDASAPKETMEEEDSLGRRRPVGGYVFTNTRRLASSSSSFCCDDEFSLVEEEEEEVDEEVSPFDERIRVREITFHS